MTLENPAARSVADDLARKIEEGVYPPCARLPSRWELREMYGVPESVAQRATNLLEAMGYVHGIKGKGVYVNQHGQHTAFWSIRPDEVPAAVRIYSRDTNELMLESTVRQPTVFTAPDFGRKCWAEIEPAVGETRTTLTTGRRIDA